VLLKDPRVTVVTALSRRGPVPLSNFNISEDDLDRSKLRQVRVDYGNEEALKSSIGPQDRGISCLGVYSQDVKNTAEFMELEYNPNLAVARAGQSLGAQRWAYLSGMGVYPSETQGFFQPMFSFVKGTIEADLAKLNFDMTMSARPGSIVGRMRHGKENDIALKGIGGAFESIMARMGVANTPIGIHSQDIAKAMVHRVLSDDKVEGLEARENQDLKKLAREYEKNYEQC